MLQRRKRKRRRGPQAPARPLRQSNRRHSSHRRHQDRRVTSQVRGRHRLGPTKGLMSYFVIQRSLRACVISHPTISALCLVEPPRPERPSWPESISVLSNKSRRSVLHARSRATHLAGSIEPGGDEHRGIASLCDIVVRRIGKHVVVFTLDGRIAPFLVFERREWDRRIRHRGNDVHKRRFRHDASIKVGTHISDRPHDETAGAAALCKHSLRIGIALRY